MAILLLGVWSAYDQSARKAATESALEELQDAVVDGLPVISADTLTNQYDGELVLIRGELAGGSVADPLTGVTLNGVWLKRLVELRQWEQRSRCRRSSTGSARDCSVYYNRVWSLDLIDSDKFATPIVGESKHVNPTEKPFEEPSFVTQTLDLGVWSVPTEFFTSAFERRTVTADDLDSSELDANWWAEGGYVYSRNNPDVRFRYDATFAPVGPVSLIAIPDNGRLTLTEELAGAPLLAAGMVEATDIIQTAGGQVRDIQQHWIFFTFAGLMLLIQPVARQFSRLDKLTGAPSGKRFAMTVGVAAAITAVIGLLLPE
ncbi:TMEM43 family protein [Lentisalinibacter sediminis]|uniref:TMEM43 family protein n=1 Tax=Lentisalinibacter sediminis TaxID=2992237 RepID=UPI003866F782